MRTPLRKLLNDLRKPQKLPKPGTCARCRHPKREHRASRLVTRFGRKDWVHTRTLYRECGHENCRCPYYIEPPKHTKARQRWMRPWNSGWRAGM